MSRLTTGWLMIGLATALLGGAGSPAAAHEIPSDVTIQVIVEPAADSLNLFVRVPLEAMQDTTFPQTADGFLDVERAAPVLRDAASLWLGNNLRLFENGMALPRPELTAVRAAIPSNRAFTDAASARFQLARAPLPAGTQLVWQQALLDTWFRVPIGSPASDFSLDPQLERLGLAVTVAVRFEPPAGTPRLFQLSGELEPLDLDPRWHAAAWRFVTQGFEHILGGMDHLLFLLCLVLPFRRDLRSLVIIVSAFTVAHSVTLIGSAFGLRPAGLWFTPLVETLIALSILYMAIENVLKPQARMRWMLAFGFGLVHGFGFSFALRDTLQFAGDNVLTALLAFNVGVELGQLAVLAVLVPALIGLFRFIPERSGIILISVLTGHVAWHWMSDRYNAFSQYDVRWFGLETTQARDR